MSKKDNIKETINIVIEKTATAGIWTIAGGDKIKLRNEDVSQSMNGITGGFNFQHTWTSGYIAAKSILGLSLLVT